VSQHYLPSAQLFLASACLIPFKRLPLPSPSTTEAYSVGSGSVGTVQTPFYYDEEVREKNALSCEGDEGRWSLEKRCGANAWSAGFGTTGPHLFGFGTV